MESIVLPTSLQMEEALKDIMAGLVTEADLFLRWKLKMIDCCSLNVEDLELYYNCIRSVKICSVAYDVKIREENKQVKILHFHQLLQFIYENLKHCVLDINENGIVFLSSKSIVFEGVELLTEFKKGLLYWKFRPEMEYVITRLLDDGFSYKILGDFDSVYSCDDLVRVSMSKFGINTIKDKNYVYRTLFPNMRRNMPDKFYGILNRNYRNYCRDHYLRDQFLNILSYIPLDRRKNVVIFNPSEFNESIYSSMGFKIYRNYMSSNMFKQQEISYITDLTGYYVLMDPIYFSDKSKDGDDTLVLQKYTNVRELCLGVGFLKYFSMDEDLGDMSFVPGYDHYIYLPHKPCFYLIPKGLTEMTGHQVIFARKGLYNFFLRTSNLVRTYAFTYSYDNLKRSSLFNILEKILTDGYITSGEYKIMSILLQAFDIYFNFPYVSYYTSFRFVPEKDDRRFIGTTDVRLLYPNENSIFTLMNIGKKNVEYKRGYYIVTDIDSDLSGLDDYSLFRRKHSTGRFVKNYKDKFVNSGPVLDEDQKTVGVKRVGGSRPWDMRGPLNNI